MRIHIPSTLAVGTLAAATVLAMAGTSFGQAGPAAPPPARGQEPSLRVATFNASLNRNAAGQLVSDFHLLDLLLQFHTELASRPLLAQVDLVRNLGADDLDDAGRASLQWGDSLAGRQWEIGYAYQRIQRDAVMAAFNSQDWWFHSAMRGHGAWLAYGFDEHWRAKVTVFIERADGRAPDLDRTLVDLEARW